MNFWLEMIALCYILISFGAVGAAGLKHIGVAFVVMAFSILIGYLLHIPYYGIGIVVLLIFGSAAIMGFDWFLSEQKVIA